MANANRIWEGDWNTRVRERVRSNGSDSVLDLLDQHPCEPYFLIARRLGNDVAAAQVARMQFEEVDGPGGFRQAAIDALSREITEQLKRGWGVGKHVEFLTADVFAGWMALLEYRVGSPPHILARGEAVWEELNRIDPPQGWKPTGTDDSILVAAFAKGWPVEAFPISSDVPIKAQN